MKTKVELLEEIVKKQEELIKMISPRGAEFWGDTSDKYLKLIKDIVSLKTQLAEAGGEKKAVAYEWHNYGTGHCYVDYIPHPLQEAGYIKRPLFYG